MVYDSAIGTLPTSSRPDYIFNGWYIDSTRIYETTIWRYASNQTATAQWTFDGYTLSTSALYIIPHNMLVVKKKW